MAAYTRAATADSVTETDSANPSNTVVEEQKCMQKKDEIGEEAISSKRGERLRGYRR